MIQFKRKTLSVAVAVTCAAITAGAMASSHREAPNITRHPALDSTDFYAFNSYEEGREGYVTSSQIIFHYKMPTAALTILLWTLTHITPSI